MPRKRKTADGNSPAMQQVQEVRDALSEDRKEFRGGFKFNGSPESMPKNRFFAEAKRQVLEKLIQMSCEGLRLYRPLPGDPERFHKCQAKWRVAVGTNRCLGGEQQVYDPVANRMWRVDEIDGTFHVVARNPISGRYVVATAEKPFVKGFGEMYRFTLSNGQTLTATMDHHALTSDGTWNSLRYAATTRQTMLSSPESSVSQRRRDYSKPSLGHTQAASRFQESSSAAQGTSLASRSRESSRSSVCVGRQASFPCLPLSISGAFPSESSGGAFRSSRKAEDFPADYLTDCRLHDGPPRWGQETAQALTPLPDDALGRTSCGSFRQPKGDLECRPSSLRCCNPEYGHPSIPCDPLRTSDLCAVRESHTCEEVALSVSLSRNQSSVRPRPWFFVERHTGHTASPCRCHPSVLASHPPVFSVGENEPQCRIIKTEYLGLKPIWDFTVRDFANYVAGGLVNANSSKTMTCATEAVRAWTASDPLKKFKPTNGFGLVVGQDTDHLSQIWTKCAKPGAFSIIPDEHTGILRAVRPDPKNPLVLDPYDVAYREKWRDAPPLIPPRMIRRVAMEDAAKGVPRLVEFDTGWKVMWRPSGGKAARGEHYDMVWFDEHIENEEFYYESIRGLVDVGSTHKSRGIWSATPQKQNFLMWDLCQRAKGGDKEITEFFFDIQHNPYIDEGERNWFRDMLPEERQLVHFYGQHAILGWRHYPEFAPMGVHGCEPFEIPREWTRYFALDPAVNGCGTVFVAVDPEEKHVWFYDEMLLPEKAGAEVWAAKMSKRDDAGTFHAWVIDEHAGRQSSIAGGDSVARQYYDALANRGVTPKVRGPRNGFFPGTGDTEARRQAMKGLMFIRDAGVYSGTSRIQVMRGRLPNLEKQIARSQRDQKNPAKRIKGRFDLLDPAEYIAHYNPSYVPDREKVTISSVVEDYLRKKKRRPQTVRTVAPGMEIS